MTYQSPQSVFETSAEKLYFVYIITDKIHHLSYVGVSKDPFKRIPTHLDSDYEKSYWKRKLAEHFAAAERQSRAQNIDINRFFSILNATPAGIKGVLNACLYEVAIMRMMVDFGFCPANSNQKGGHDDLTERRGKKNARYMADADYFELVVDFSAPHPLQKRMSQDEYAILTKRLPEIERYFESNDVFKTYIISPLKQKLEEYRSAHMNLDRHSMQVTIDEISVSFGFEQQTLELPKGKRRLPRIIRTQPA